MVTKNSPALRFSNKFEVRCTFLEVRKSCEENC